MLMSFTFVKQQNKETATMHTAEPEDLGDNSVCFFPACSRNTCGQSTPDVIELYGQAHSNYRMYCLLFHL